MECKYCEKKKSDEYFFEVKGIEEPVCVSCLTPVAAQLEAKGEQYLELRPWIWRDK